MGRLKDYLHFKQKDHMKRITSGKINEVRQELLENQNFKCSMCDEDLKDEDNTNRHVDHNHDSGMIRGVLCRRCNLLEGTLYYRFRRSGHVGKETDYIWWLEKHLAYLKKPETQYEHPEHFNKKWKRFRNLGKEDQLKELAGLGIIPEGKQTKKDLLKLFKKAIKS